MPPDDPRRALLIADAKSANARHIAVGGDTYTILVSGADTNGRYCLIDMHVPPDGGPPPHRHDFEEMFTLLEGEVAFAFRGETLTIRRDPTVNIPATPRTLSGTYRTPRRGCYACARGRTGGVLPAPTLSKDQQEAMMKLAKMLAPRHRTEHPV